MYNELNILATAIGVAVAVVVVVKEHPYPYPPPRMGRQQQQHQRQPVRGLHPLLHYVGPSLQTTLNDTHQNPFTFVISMNGKKLYTYDTP
jgi:hypothetical protein